jgi:lysozyme
MQTSEKGLNVIRSFEGRALRAYQDSVGVWTIGYGNTNYDENFVSRFGKVQRGLAITAEQAEDVFVESIRKKYEPEVNRRLPGVGQAQFDAGTSFHYNTGAIARASWPAALLVGAMDVVRASLTSWNKAGGKVLAGLTRRRNREWLMCRSSDYGNEGSMGPVEIGEDGRPTGRQLGAPSAVNTAGTPIAPTGKTIPGGPGMLVQGSVGPEVKELNEHLILLGYKAPISDLFGPETQAAVRSFQGHHRDLTADGIVGPATSCQLLRELAMKEKLERTAKTTVVITGAGTAASAAGFLTLKVAFLLGGAALLGGLIIVVMQHRTELHTAWNFIFDIKVP